MNHPDFAQQSQAAKDQIAAVHADNPQAQKTIQHQLLVPIALSHILPPGVSGLFIAMILFMMISCDATYLHSWGSIIIQDVIMPFRKKPFTPRQHLWMLRLGIALVAIYAFFFGLYFNQVTYILMFFALTGAIWLGGAGAVILGGLYWKRGTTQGAYSGLIVGSLLAVMAIGLEQTWTKVVPILTKWFPNWQMLADYPDKFPINGQWMYLISMVAAVIVYVIVSLITCREPFNMDRMLHRGEYAVENKNIERTSGSKRRFSLSVFLGFDEQFTRSDKLLSWSVFIWTMLNFAIFIFVIIANFFSSWSNKAWADYFFVFSIVVPLIIGAITSVWFTIGGTWDLRRMFQRLKEQKRNDLDDGRVVGHMNADDLARFGKEADKLATDEINIEGATQKIKSSLREEIQ
jgi:SSS family solute:Na+ symporter